jgi:integrase/recombinase XerD
MSALGQVLEDYLALRRSLGYELEREGKLLPGFVAYLEEARSPFITTTHAMAWAMLPRSASTGWWARRLDWVRGFARYAQTLDPRTEVPAHDLLSRPRTKPPPHLYAESEVLELLAAADRLRGPLRPLTYRTLIGLLAVTGLRVGEAIALDRGDVDGDEAVITVRQGKLGKAREVAIDPTTVAALQIYSAARDRTLSRSTQPSFFASQRGTRLIYNNVHRTFLRLVDAAGLAGAKPRRPRIHDLRHSFAIRSLIEWYRTGIDVERRLPLLSTYLGHVSPSSTYWYLTAVPELMGA